MTKPTTPFDLGRFATEYKQQIDDFFTQNPTPKSNLIYSSQDQRIAISKDGVIERSMTVDLNTFSAGWRLVTEYGDVEGAIAWFRERFRHDGITHVVLVPENSGAISSRPEYWESVRALANILEAALGGNPQQGLKHVLIRTIGEPCIVHGLPERIRNKNNLKKQEHDKYLNAKEILKQKGYDLSSIQKFDKEELRNIDGTFGLVPNTDFDDDPSHETDNAVYPDELKEENLKDVVKISYQNPEDMGWDKRKKVTFGRLTRELVKNLANEIFPDDLEKRRQLTRALSQRAVNATFNRENIDKEIAATNNLIRKRKDQIVEQHMTPEERKRINDLEKNINLSILPFYDSDDHSNPKNDLRKEKSSVFSTQKAYFDNDPEIKRLTKRNAIMEQRLEAYNKTGKLRVDPNTPAQCEAIVNELLDPIAMCIGKSVKSQFIRGHVHINQDGKMQVVNYLKINDGTFGVGVCPLTFILDCDPNIPILSEKDVNNFLRSNLENIRTQLKNQLFAQVENTNDQGNHRTQSAFTAVFGKLYNGISELIVEEGVETGLRYNPASQALLESSNDDPSAMPAEPLIYSVFGSEKGNIALRAARFLPAGVSSCSNTGVSPEAANLNRTGQTYGRIKEIDPKAAAVSSLTARLAMRVHTEETRQAKNSVRPTLKSQYKTGDWGQYMTAQHEPTKGIKY